MAETPPRGSKGGRSSAAEHEHRLRCTERAMSELVSDRAAARKMVKKFGVHWATAAKWVRTIHERWAAEAKARAAVDRDERREEHRRRLAGIMAENRGEEGSPRVRLDAAVRLAQLDGFLTTQKVEVSGSITHQVDLDAQQREAARAVLRRRGYAPPAAPKASTSPAAKA